MMRMPAAKAPTKRMPMAGAYLRRARRGTEPRGVGESVAGERHAFEDDEAAYDGGHGADHDGGDEAAAHELQRPGIAYVIEDLSHGPRRSCPPAAPPGGAA